MSEKIELSKLKKLYEAYVEKGDTQSAKKIVGIIRKSLSEKDNKLDIEE
jgi:hypothetical protein